MNGVNKVILVGTLGNDPEVRYTQQGVAVASISLATNEKWKDSAGVQQERTEWHRVTMFRRLGEIAGEYLRKGSQIYVEGKLHTNKWQDQQGNDRYTTSVLADQMQMLGGRNQDQAGGQGNYNQAQSQGQPQRNQNMNPDGTPVNPAQYKQNQQAGRQQNRQARPPMPEPDFDFDDDIPF